MITLAIVFAIGIAMISLSLAFDAHRRVDVIKKEIGPSLQNLKTIFDQMVLNQEVNKADLIQRIDHIQDLIARREGQG